MIIYLVRILILSFTLNLAACGKHSESHTKSAPLAQSGSVRDEAEISEPKMKPHDPVDHQEVAKERDQPKSNPNDAKTKDRSYPSEKRDPTKSSSEAASQTEFQKKSESPSAESHSSKNGGSNHVKKSTVEIESDDEDEISSETKYCSHPQFESEQKTDNNSKPLHTQNTRKSCTAEKADTIFHPLVHEEETKNPITFVEETKLSTENAGDSGDLLTATRAKRTLQASSDLGKSLTAQDLNLYLVKETVQPPLGLKPEHHLENESGDQSEIRSESTTPSKTDVLTSVMESMSFEGTKIWINQPLFLMDPSHSSPKRQTDTLFMIPELGLGAPIRVAQFVHETHSVVQPLPKNFSLFQPLSKKYRSPHQKNLFHDYKNKRWSISLAQLFEHSDPLYVSNINSEDLQILHLDLVLNTMQTIQIQIYFRVVGRLPEAQSWNYTPIVLERPSFKAREHVRRYSTEEVIVRAEEYTNPTEQTFKLWVKVNSSSLSPFRLESFLQQPDPLKNNSDQASISWKSYVSQASFHISSIRAVHQSKVQEMRDLETSDDRRSWVSFLIEPKETLRIEYLASPNKEVRLCTLPGEVFSLFKVKPGSAFQANAAIKENNSMLTDLAEESSPRVKASSTQLWKLAGSGNDHNSKDQTYFSPLALQLQIYRGSFKGSFRREIHVSYPFVKKNEEEGSTLIDQEDLIKNADLREVRPSREVHFSHEEDDRPSQRKRGTNRKFLQNSEMFECQGIFR